MNSSIHYFNEDSDFQLKDQEHYSNWLASIIKLEGFVVGNINYIFCSDSHLHGINKQYLDHDTLTDIITFDQSEEENTVEGDIFISIDRITENHKNYKADFDIELQRVMAHGILHLTGYGDKTPGEKEEMRTKEQSAIAMF